MTAPPLQVLIEPYLRRIEAHFLIEGALALIAALFAIALRRQTRLFKPIGFIMLALGLIIDMMIPQTAELRIWAHIGRAVALTLVVFGLIRLAVEAFLILRYRRKADPSTIVAEIILTALYGITALAVLRFMLGVDPRVLLAVPALGTLVVGWIRQANFFSGMLIQYHRPFKSGDWVRLGNQVGRVSGTGWRASWMVTRANENVQIPNAFLAAQPVINYSSGGEMVADEIYLDIDRDASPDQVERTIGTLLGDIPEIRSSEVDVWEYQDTTIRYRIRFWLADYAEQERIRTTIARTLWYSLRRNAIELASPTRTIFTELNRNENHVPQATTGELRRVYLLDALSDQELGILVSTIRVCRFARGEVLMREGDEGDRFYILRKGKVEILAKEQGGDVQKHIRDIEASSPENFFGEIALLTGGKRNATIRAVTDVEVLEIGRDGFAKLFRAMPGSGASLAEVAGRRSMETTEATTLTAIAPAAHEAAVRRRTATILVAMRRIFDF